jgi:hypothetical protein
MMRITAIRRRFGLVVIAVLLAMVFSLLGTVTHPLSAHASSGCTQVNDIQDSLPYVVAPLYHNFPYGTSQVGTMYVHIDALVNGGTTCDVRARADVFPVQAHPNLYGPFQVQLCANAPETEACLPGNVLDAVTYYCPSVSYPNHCAIVGNWINADFTPPFCEMDLDAASWTMNTDLNYGINAEAYIDHWC